MKAKRKENLLCDCFPRQVETDILLLTQRQNKASRLRSATEVPLENLRSWAGGLTLNLFN